jgi:hypothetical protein
MAVCSTAENSYTGCSNIGDSSFRSLSFTFTSVSPVRLSSVTSTATIWKKITSYIYITSKFSGSWICLTRFCNGSCGGVFCNLLYALYTSQSFHWLYPSLLRYTPLNRPARKNTRSAIHCAGPDAVSPRQFLL